MLIYTYRHTAQFDLYLSYWYCIYEMFSLEMSLKNVLVVTCYVVLNWNEERNTSASFANVLFFKC